MPFTKCQRCGRLFHTFEPLMPGSPNSYWPNLSLGDAVYELCPECLKASRDERDDPDPNADAAQIEE